MTSTNDSLSKQTSDNRKLKIEMVFLQWHKSSFTSFLLHKKEDLTFWQKRVVRKVSRPSHVSLRCRTQTSYMKTENVTTRRESLSLGKQKETGSCSPPVANLEKLEYNGLTSITSATFLFRELLHDVRWWSPSSSFNERRTVTSHERKGRKRMVKIM